MYQIPDDWRKAIINPIFKKVVGETVTTIRE
jgi:hypothetical protein